MPTTTTIHLAPTAMTICTTTVIDTPVDKATTAQQALHYQLRSPNKLRMVLIAFQHVHRGTIVKTLKCVPMASTWPMIKLLVSIVKLAKFVD